MNPETVNVVELPQLNGTVSKGTRLGHRLDLIEKLKVPVKAVIGTTETSVSKLFSMTAGEVVALDQEVDSLVEVYANDKLIARGKLVAAGDRLGVRIVDLLQE